jgi:tetratricopeptide (TPR) repeat protein
MSRWAVAVADALACFGGCWGGLAAGRVLDTGSQVGIASVPLVIVLTVVGAWAERAREKKPEANPQGERAGAEVRDSLQGQAIGLVRDGGLVIGPGAVFNVGGQEDHGKEPLRDKATGSDGILVVGDVPLEPAAFQPRAGLMASLERKPEGRMSAVFAITGIRGVGKTQMAAAYARRRIADGWRLVAWVDASDEHSVVAGLARVAVAAGVGAAGDDARDLADGVRHWLEGDGRRSLVVFDNSGDLDGLRPFLPVAGAAHVVITSVRQSTSVLGAAVPVEVFTAEEAVTYLAERTGLDDAAGARELAEELGFLPLGLAQAAAVIAREHLGYGTYLGRLGEQLVEDYMRRVEGDAYPYRLAEAIVLSLRAVEAGDPSGRCARLMGLVSLLAETGVPRRVLHLAASSSILEGGENGTAELDAALGQLAGVSLLGFTQDDSVVAHRLVMRVVRERLTSEGTLSAISAGAVQLLAQLAWDMDDPWRGLIGVRELAGQVSALAGHLAGHLDGAERELVADLLRLRLQAVGLLNMVNDSTDQAIAAAEPLGAECELALGADHPDTLTSRSLLAWAYLNARQAPEAIELFEQNLSVRERVQGADHPDTLAARLYLSAAYTAVGRRAEAISLAKQVLAVRERVQGADHPDTLAARVDLAAAYSLAGRGAEAITVFEQVLAVRERVQGADHLDTLAARDYLATACQAAGRASDAIPLHQQNVVARQRVLGADHPDTLSSRSHLATAYYEVGDRAEGILLLERVLADQERILGADHPSTLTTRGNLAQAERATAERISLSEQVLAIAEQRLGGDHLDTLIARHRLAIHYFDAGRAAEAVSLLERVLAARERVLGANDPDTLIWGSDLATAYSKVGRVAEAIALLERTVALCERMLGADHPHTIVVRENLAAARTWILTEEQDR